MHRAPGLAVRLLSLIALSLLAACSPYKFVGDRVMSFGEHAVMPAALADDDPQMACHAAEAFTAATLAFASVGTDVDPMAVLLYTADGICIEVKAFDAEMRYLRALAQQDTAAAGDARIMQKRYHELAARRQYLAWQRFIAVYGDLQEGQCPARFRSDFDQTVFLVGLIAGIQATLNDALAGQAVGVPRDIVPRAVHLSHCLDSERWWQVPLSIRGALWVILPSLAPPGTDPMALLEQNAHAGAARGVRLAHVVWAMSAHSSGDTATTRRAIRDFAAMPPANVDPRHRLLDRIAASVMLGLSDRLWTEATGARTPPGRFGSFPDEMPPDGLPPGNSSAGID